MLITRHLDFSLPYRLLFSGPGVADLRNSLLDALAELLVRIHLAGFFWGDCSLSNTLFRRDAGTLSAYLVDAETGELHPQLSTGQRAHDLQIAEENVAGELLDLEAARGRPALGPRSARDGRRGAAPLRGAVVGADARGRVRAGRDLPHRRAPAPPQRASASTSRRCSSWATPAARRCASTRRSSSPGTTAAGCTRSPASTCRRTRRAACSTTSPRSAPRAAARAAPESVVAYRWLTECFEPSIAAVPADLRGKREAAELFHEILEHRWFLSEAAQRDVGMPAAVDSYIDEVLRHRPDEKAVLDARARTTTGLAALAGSSSRRRMPAAGTWTQPGRLSARSAARRAPSPARRRPAGRRVRRRGSGRSD